MPVSLPVGDPVLDTGVRAMACLQERELPAGGVGGERLVAVAVADLERVQRRAGMWVFAADDDAHPGTRAGPAAEVEQAGDLDGVGVLTQGAVGVVRRGPGVGGDDLDGVADRFGDRVADGEVPVPAPKAR